MRSIAFLIVMSFLPGIVSAQSAEDRRIAADIDSMVKRVMAVSGTPGLSVAVVHGDMPILVRGYGLADIERGRPVTANTVFYIASTTKAFTALNVALMAEQGTLSLDAPVSSYLPGVQWGENVHADSITLRRLLTHTHGIENSGPVVYRTAFSGVHTNQLLKDLLRYHPASSAGATYRYTNVGYNIAGLVIDEVTKSKWQDLLETNVLKPLGMNSTTAYLSRFDSAQLAMPYSPEPAGPRRVHYAKGDGNMQAAGGLVSTAADLAKWLEMQINLGRLDGKQVFPARVVAETQRIQAPIEVKEGGGATPSIGYTLGWNVSVVNGDTVLHHGGGFSAFRTYIAFGKNSKIGVALMTNESAYGGRVIDFLTDYVIDRARGVTDTEERFNERLAPFEAQLQKGREAIAADRARRAARPQMLPLPMQAYAGTYENAQIGTMRWTVSDGRLWAEIGLLKSIAEVFDGTTHRLRVEMEPGSGEVVEFKVVDGKVTGVKFSNRDFVRR
jgi:CubicO group peptidase (beta-lactamase class C family)